MKKTKTITLTGDQILHALTLLMQKCKSQGLQSFDFPMDLYWSLEPEKSFEMSLGEPELLVGNIYDDAETIPNIDDNFHALIGLDLSRIANILNYIAFKFPALSSE